MCVIKLIMQLFLFFCFDLKNYNVFEKPNPCLKTIDDYSPWTEIFPEFVIIHTEKQICYQNYQTCQMSIKQPNTILKIKISSCFWNGKR